MKYIVRSLLVVGSLLLAGTASAEFATDWNPYIGLDYYHVWMKGRTGTGGLGNGVATNYPGMSVYVGSKFNECLGLEFGGDWSFQRTRRVAVTGGNVRNRVNRWGLHLDLVGFLPVAECFDLFGAVGIGYVNANYRSTPEGTIAGVSPESRTYSGAVFRLGVGASYMVTECVGLRAKVGWETTSGLRRGGATRLRGFQDSITLNLGAFMKF